MRAHRFSLLTLLQAAARNGEELMLVRKLLNPTETLRVLPLEITFRPFQGDDTPRRSRLWNTLGHLFLEAENWDHDGGRFWREVIAICPIAEAADLQIPIPLGPIQLDFANSLRDQRTRESRRQHQILRLPIHSSIEAAVSEIAQNVPCAWPTLSAEDKTAPHRSRQKEIELWFTVKDLAQTAILAAGPDASDDDKDEAKENALPSRPILKETLPGQTGVLEYRLHHNNGDFELSETYRSRMFAQEVSWRYEICRDNREVTKGVFLPIDTLNVLLQDQLAWSHWSWVPSKDPADLGTFCRAIQPSGEFSKIRQYLGGSFNVAWHDAINAACKFDSFALIASCALRPKSGALITRRLRMARARTCYFRLFYRGGVIVGVLLKHCWAFGGAVRPSAPTAFTGNLEGMTGKKFSSA